MGNSGRRCVGMFDPRLIRLVACVVLIALLPLATGCYGSFPLTHIIYRFNGEVTHYDLVHSIVFWVFIIIPVYWVGFVGDVIVLNLIEFWTGEKMTVSSQTLPDGTHRRAGAFRRRKGGRADRFARWPGAGKNPLCQGFRKRDAGVR